MVWVCAFEMAACAGWAAEKNMSEPDLYVKLPNFVVPIIQDRTVKIIYKLGLFLELTNPQHGETVGLLRPRLIDAILVDLYGALGVIWDSAYQIKLTELKERLLRVARTITGEGVIKDILIQEFQSQ